MLKRFSTVLAILMFAEMALAGDKAAINTKGLFNDYAIKGYDSVSYWTESSAVKGNKEFAFSWRGAQWLFSSEENLQTFKSNPEKYAPQYGGYCAWAMADGKGRAVSIDPDAWYIHEQKLYLNFNQKVKEEWLKSKDKDIPVADKNYPTLTDVSRYTGLGS